MKEIKFRSWCNETSNMCNSSEYDGELPTGLFMSIDECKKDGKTFELMQYTGLKDKNGVECFENDLIKMYGSKVYKVKYCEAGFAYFLGDIHYGWLSCSAPFEVIGNIHQDNNLLGK